MNPLRHLARTVAHRYSLTVTALTDDLSPTVAEEDVTGYRTKSQWQVWLDTVHDGGKKKVPNPNPATARRFPQVSFSSALKDDAFRAKAEEEFNKWKEDNPASGGGGGRRPKPPSTPRTRKPAKPAPPPKPAGRLLTDDKLPSGIIEVGDAKIDIMGYNVTPEALTALFGDRQPTVESLAKMYTPTGYKSQIDVRMSGGVLYVNTTLYDQNGYRAGTIQRNFEKKKVEGKDKLVVHHELLKLEGKNTKGKGTGSEILKNSFDAYREMGVNMVEQGCAWDGRYVWPRMGYKLTPKYFKEAKDHLKDTIRQHLANNMAGTYRDLSDYADKIDKWVDENVNDTQAIADLVLPDGTEIGKESFLSGDYHEVTLDLIDGDKNYERMKRYLAGDKSRDKKKVDVSLEDKLSPGEDDDWGDELESVPEETKKAAIRRAMRRA